MALSILAPGFRFHPTDDELVMYYLKRKLLGKITGNAIAEVNIYDFSPWDLPDKSSLRSRDLEWFFFCPKARKYSSGSRANRATETGFWKATGKDRKIIYNEKAVAIKKTLVFHRGHAGNGERTDWVMHEYKMEDDHLANAGIIQDVQDMYVLCKIFEKSGAGPKNGAQYGAPFNEEEWDDDVGPDGATNPLNHKQKGPCITEMTVAPQSSLSITEPGSSTITFSANEIRSRLSYKQKGSATIDPSSVTEPAPSTVTFSANETANTLNHKQKGSATMNITVPQSTHGVSLTEPGSSTFIFSANERHVDIPANNDMMLFEDVASIMGASTDINGNNKNEIQQGVEVGNGEKANHMACNEDRHIFDELITLVDLDELTDASDIFKNDGAEYALDRIPTADDDLDADLGVFYVD